VALRIGQWQPTGPAEVRKVRAAVRTDAVAALAAAMLLWPFPVMRANVSWAVHVPLLVAFVWLTEWALPWVCLLLWGRTFGMYLFDLGLEGAPRPLRAVVASKWSLGTALVALPLLTLGQTDATAGLPARLSGLRTVAVASPDRAGSAGDSGAS
jgi:hypothetical protein